MVQLSLFALPLLLLSGNAAASYRHSAHSPGIVVPINDSLDRRQSSINIPTNLTEAQRTAGYNQSCIAASSLQGKANLTADINNLTVNSIAIQTSFQSIGAQLSFIDSEKLDKNITFSPRWANISQQWSNILWGSRDTATDTATQIGSFVEIIMPFIVSESDEPTALEVLQEFQGEVNTLQTNAQTTSDNFANLVKDLEAFILDFGQFAQELETYDNSTILKLTAQVTSLQADLSKLEIELIALGVSIGVTAIATAALAVCLPLFSFGIIFFGVTAIIGEAAAMVALGVEYANDKSKIASLNSQINTLQAQLGTIDEAQSTLSTISNTTVPTMINGLSSFTNIWTIINSDIEQSMGFINGSIAEQDPPFIFWTTLNQVPCVYEQLIPALQNYADGIADSGIPPAASVKGFTPLVKMDAEQHQATVQSIITNAQLRSSSLD